MEKIVKFSFFKNQFWRTTLTLVSGNLISHILSIFTIPILSRLYTVSEFGLNTFIISTSSILVSIVSFGLTSAIMIPLNDKDGNELLSLTFFLSSFFSVIFSSILFLLSLIFFNGFLFNSIIDWILMLLVSLMVSFSSQLVVYTNRKKMDKVLFWISFFGPLSSLFISIPLGVFKITSYGLTISVLVSYFFQIVFMLLKTKPIITLPSRRIIRKLIVNYSSFIKYQYPSNLINNFAQQIPNQIIALMFGTTNLGFISITDRLLGFPLRFIAAPIGTVYFRSINEFKSLNKDLSLFTFRIICLFLILGFIPHVVLIVWGENIFNLLLGPQWQIAGKLSTYFIFLYIMLFFQGITSYLKVSLGKQKVNLFLTIFKIIIICLPFGISYFLSQSFEITMLIYCFINVIYLIFEMGLNFHFLGKYKMNYVLLILSYFSLVIVISQLLIYFI